MTRGSQNRYRALTLGDFSARVAYKIHATKGSTGDFLDGVEAMGSTQSDCHGLYQINFEYEFNKGPVLKIGSIPMNLPKTTFSVFAYDKLTADSAKESACALNGKSKVQCTREIAYGRRGMMRNPGGSCDWSTLCN